MCAVRRCKEREDVGLPALHTRHCARRCSSGCRNRSILSASRFSLHISHLDLSHTLQVLGKHTDSVSRALSAHRSHFPICALNVVWPGLFDYVAVHLRRNDYQYTIAGHPDQHINNLKNQLKPGENIYVATDELDGNYLEQWRTKLPGHKVFSSKDFKKVYEPLGFRRLGLLEQVVCSGSRVFLGMPMSTYSGNIKNIRRHIARVPGAPNLESIYLFEGMKNPSYDAR